MAATSPQRFRTISEYHQFRELPKPQHPLISLVNVEAIRLKETEPKAIMNDFYTIALKTIISGKMRYGQQEYDFDEGTMFFISPGQVYSIDAGGVLRHSGWVLLIHPDFLWNTPLSKAIKHYDFFGYSVNEALFLSDKEKVIITNIAENIDREYNSNIDRFSQNIIIAQLELLLGYADRFYHRQFLTRKISNHKILDKLESLLTAYFNSDALSINGLPTVQYIADSLNVSPNYLSGLLKVLTGQSTQQHIHDKLIEKAKEKLSTTTLSVSEIAYELGFEHSQSFSKLFRTKTNLSPLEFRQAFN
ncbi:AraC family transcriptional regulator [Flavobacterium album]|uniref:AraC family transcriptional regulator n=1 Tax=Flavobacterium album TaxID=2175091 RepID=A0A2S1QZP5_9FLAO|nr:helix-turn-helix transcriptional regulator [Flavobacterium album]AWH85878.1 AraC family transcriptional regulator [Flavobacterium album]